MATTLSLSTHHPTPPFSHHHRHHRLSFPIHITSSTSRIPSTPPPNSSNNSTNNTTIPSVNLYQPFRPPTTPLPPKYLSLSPEDRLDVLRNRLGLWHHYAPLITSLQLTPSSIHEITGITPIDQNLLAVASKVRDSLLASSLPPHILSFFDSASGADLLYALRLLNSRHRAAAAAYFAENRVDSKELAEEVARAVKEFPRRRGEKGWECFSPDSPPDCLAYTYFRFSREALSDGDRNSALEKALGLTVTERARKRIVDEMQKNVGGKVVEEEEELVELAAVPVVKLRYGEVSEATSVVVLPVCRAVDGIGELEAAPRECKLEGGLGVVRADRGWGRGGVLPGWGPAALVAENGGLAVEFGDGRVLPWRKYRWGKEETVLVVVDRRRKAVEGDGYYLVEGGGNGEDGLTVERGGKILESGKTEAIGAVVLVVRPPAEEDGDRLRDEDWE